MGFAQLAPARAHLPRVSRVPNLFPPTPTLPFPLGLITHQAEDLPSPPPQRIKHPKTLHLPVQEAAGRQQGTGGGSGWAAVLGPSVTSLEMARPHPLGRVEGG